MDTLVFLLLLTMLLNELKLYQQRMLMQTHP
jgi:hypothetical protein